MRDQQILDLWQSYNLIYSNITESHFKVGDEVVCKASGMEGEVVKVDPEEKGKYYTVKREDGKTMKYAPDELKIEKEEDEKEDEKEAKNGGVPKKKEEKFHTKLDKLVHNTFGSSPEEKKMKEEVEIAAQYFYEMGLNEDGVDILIEELGEEEFANFVYDISEEYVLTEARAGGTRIEPVTAKGQKFKSGKPTGKSLQRLRAQKAARRDAEEKSSASKPSGMKASLQRQSAVAAAAKKQPKKPGVLDRIAGAVNRGIERHNMAMSAAKETGKVIRKAAGHVGGVAKEVGKGASGAAKLAAHVARKGLNDEYIMGYLIDEGYAETPEAAKSIMANMSEEWRESILDEEFLDERNRGEQGMSDREVTRRRNLGGNVRSKVSASSLGDHGSQSAIQKFHKTKANQRRAIHKSGRYTRGDTGESGGQGRYQANKDHSDGYPSITKRGQGPG